MTNRIINYQKLTPTIADDINYYEEFLDYAYSEKDLLNIALTGRYGAGKSSVWKGYETKKKMGDSTIHISLTNFNDANINSGTNEELDNNIMNNNINKKDINRIEFQILNQILYQIDNKKVPNAKYKVKQTMDKYLFWETFGMFSMFMLGIISVFFEKQIKFILLDKFPDLNVNMLWLTVSILLLLIPLVLLFKKYLKKELKYFDIKKISFRDSQLEFDSDKEESLFDRDQDEIVYIIRESGIQTIVFEDLDRFNNIEIFNKLRIINSLVNLDKKEEEKVRFVYMLRDNVFLSKDRTKFFDFLIPIVPILDSSNSRGILLDIFKEELNTKYSPNEKMIERISIYIDDMRLLKNVYNEYIIYMGRIDAKKRKLDPDKLLGIMTYKNIFPSDYEKLQQNKGYIFELFYKYKEKVSSIIEKIQEEINILNDEIIKLKQMIEEDYPSLMAAYFPTDRLYEKAIGFKNLKEFTKYLIENTDERYRYRTNSSSGAQIYGRDIIKELNKNQDYKERSELLKDSENRTAAIKNRSDIVKTLDTEKKRINSMTLKELLGKHIEQTIFEEIDNEIIDEHYFPLIRFLVINGYIDETYREYLSYFYESSITANDQVFLRSIYENIALEYEYRLDNPPEVLSNLVVSDFTRDSSLNFELLKVVVQKKEDNIFDQILETLYRKKDMSFLNDYLKYCNEKDKLYFVNKQLEHDLYYLSKWIKAEEVDNDNKLLVVDSALKLSKSKLLEVNKNNNLATYLESNPTVLEYYNEKNIKEPIKGMIILNVEFKKLNMAHINYYVLKMIVENNLYDINFSNINYILNQLVYSNNGKEEEIISRQYTIINSSDKLVNMKSYVMKNIEKYLLSYIENLSDNTILRNSENDTITILNSDIDYELIEKYIDHNETILTNIIDIKHNDLWKLIFINELILKTRLNVKAYYETIGMLDNTLLNFINSMNYEAINQWITTMKEYSELEMEIINTKGINIALIKELAEVIDYKIPYINTGFSIEHIELLIKHKNIEMNQENILLIYENYEGYIVEFIENEIEKYFMLLDEIDHEKYKTIFSDNLVYSLLNSDNIDFEYKKMIIERYNEEFKLSKVIDTSIDVKNEIINKEIDMSEIPKLINSYYDSENKKILKEIVIENFYDINFNEIYKPLQIIEDLILGGDSDRLGIDVKIELLCLGIENKATAKNMKNWLKSIPEMIDLYNVFNNKNPIINSSSHQYKVASKLNEYGFISLKDDKRESDAFRLYLLNKGRKQGKHDQNTTDILF